MIIRDIKYKYSSAFLNDKKYTFKNGERLYVQLSYIIAKYCTKDKQH